MSRGSRSAPCDGRARVAEHRARRLQLQIGRDQPDAVGDRGVPADLSCYVSRFLDHPGLQTTGSSSSPAERGQQHELAAHSTLRQKVVYPLVDPKPSCATTAANGRHGWIPVLRQHPLGRQGRAESRHSARSAGGFGHGGRSRYLIISGSWPATLWRFLHDSQRMIVGIFEERHP
jgi:hypothetical protein